MNVTDRGYREIEHAADWELEVWGPDMETLLVQAARGMYGLMGVNLVSGGRIERRLELEADGPEDLLVDFLGELLYLLESEGIAFNELSLKVDGRRLRALLEGGPIAARGKEIKAVTYHRLEVQRGDCGLQTRVVFDV